jgi:carbohydrate-selective porin OprB
MAARARTITISLITHVLTFGIMGMTKAVFAQSTDINQPTKQTWLEQDHINGNWGGPRQQLENAGIAINSEYVAEYSAVLSGGVEEKPSFRNLLTFDIALDMNAMANIQGGTFFIQYLHVNAERGGSGDAGDLQGYSNIENDRSLDVIYELWYEQLLLDDRLRIKVGKVDANAEFFYVDAAGDFANSSAGFSPSVQAFPSYPDPAMSVNIFATLLNEEDWSLTLGYGLYDGAPGVDGIPTGSRGPATFFSDNKSDDYFHAIEASLAWNQLGSLPAGRFAIGYWQHTGTFDRFDGNTDDGTDGFTLSFEQRLNTLDEPDSERGVYVFTQYGYADEHVAEIAQHIAAGIVGRGLINSRPDDAMGLYVSYADLSDDSSAGFDKDEWALDLYYKFQITPAIYIQPELQYIINPSGDPSIDDALVGGLRAGITF